MTGKLSDHLIFFLQFGQLDLPDKIPFLFFGKRMIKTLKKLPKINPKTNNVV